MIMPFEMLLEEQIRSLRRIDDRKAAYVREALADHRGWLRHVLGFAFVRIGISLDPDARECALVCAQQAPH